MEYVKYDPKQREALKKNLRRLMDEKGVTKAQLSRKLGWSYNTIDYWLRGDRVPDKTGIEAICDYFGISDVELLGSEMKVRTFAYYKWKRSQNKRAERSSHCGVFFAIRSDSTKQLKHT